MNHGGRNNGAPSRSRLYRDPENGMLMGVCAGIADYAGLTPLIVRIVTVVGLFMFTVPTLLGYLILGIALPKRPRDLYQDDDDAAFWREVRTEPGRAASDLERRFDDLERRLRTSEAHVTSEAFKLNRAFRDMER